MIDLGFVGARFTWSHGTSEEGRRSAWLDRAMGEDKWRRLFPTAKVIHLQHAHSDHCPLLLELDEDHSSRLGERPFYFEAAWLMEAGFHDMLKKEWKGEEKLHCALRDLSTKLKDWNKMTFGNIFKRKKRNELRLGGVQRAISNSQSHFMVRLERELREERRLILLQEEMLWLQKSRVNWLRHGDSNTKFFHTTALIRKHKNKIEALVNSEGRWVEEKEQLKDLAVDFYTNLFQSEMEQPVEYLLGKFPIFDTEQGTVWDEEYTREEIRKALHQMGSWKALGPDGYRAGWV